MSRAIGQVRRLAVHARAPIPKSERVVRYEPVPGVNGLLVAHQAAELHAAGALGDRRPGGWNDQLTRLARTVSYLVTMSVQANPNAWRRNTVVIDEEQ